MHVQISAIDDDIPVSARIHADGAAYVSFHSPPARRDTDEMVLQHNDPEYLASRLEAAAAAVREAASLPMPSVNSDDAQEQAA